MRDMPWRFLRGFSQRSIARNADLRIEGIEHVPKKGPALLVVRHVHHQHDGEVLLAAIDRPVHLIVAADWATNPAMHRLLRFACERAEWPAVIRDEAFARFGEENARRINARALRQSVRLLQQGKIVAIFPQAYPLIDNNPRPGSLPDGELPFRRGFETIARVADRLGTPTPIIPVGLDYEKSERWRITVRFGTPINAGAHSSECARLTIEERVLALSEKSRDDIVRPIQ